ncbi:Methyltransferase-like protein 23 [Quaeritorhiza haematococci]|nr:Methyltransferase-like protein 23 [Quaeritorhiza haematococci]
MSSSTTSDLRPHFQSTIRQITFQPRPPSSDRTPARSTPNSKHSTVDPDCDSVDDPNTTVTITIRELLDPDYGSYIWPSALVLSQFLWDNRKWLFGFVGNRGFSRRSRAGRDVGGKEKQGKESGGSVNALSLLATYTDEDSEDDESEVDDQCGEGGKGRRLAQLDQEQPKQAQDSPQLPSPPGDLSQIFTSLPVRNVLELGCGTALPGLLSYALGARRVLLTDRPEGTHVLDNVKWHIQQNLKQRGEFRDDIAVNGMGKQEEGEITVTPLRWGDFVPSVAKLGSFLGYKSLPRRTGIEQGQRTIDLDLIIGADVFYDPKDFDDLLATPEMWPEMRE